MSVQMFEMDDVGSVVSADSYNKNRLQHAPAPMSEASSCPPVPLPRRAKMKKSSAPPPPTKVTTPLSQSASNLDSFHSGSSSGPPPPLSSCDSSGPLPMGPQQHVSDDCAINELLEGRMDLEVSLPDGRQVRMNVERRTPMMDLLVQVTTANKISPGGHVIHILTDRGKDFIHYKPSTPIGSLDTNSVYIVPKSSIIDPPVKKMPKVVNKPFEQTFRLQVNLPRGQLMVHRVSPRTTLSDIKLMTCREKMLDSSRYQLVHPQFPNQILDLNSTLSSYGCNEISLMSISNINANIRNSTSDLIAYTSREDDKKKKGILGLFTRKKSKGSVVDSSSDSMDSRGVSPTRSDSSGNQKGGGGKISVKKRPAPPPPASLRKTDVNQQSSSGIISTKTTEDVAMEAAEAGSTVSHSRHSSDSSGYHEASLLSESPDIAAADICGASGSSTDSAITTRTETPVKSTRKSSTPTKPKLSAATSDSNLSTSGINKKRRAPPPPPSPSKSESNLKLPLSSTSSNELSIPEEDDVTRTTTVTSKTTVEVLPEPHIQPSVSCSVAAAVASKLISSSNPDIAVSSAMKESRDTPVEEVPFQYKKPIVEVADVASKTTTVTIENAQIEPSIGKTTSTSSPEPKTCPSVESSTPSSPIMDSGIGLGESDDPMDEDRGDDLDEDKEALFLLRKETFMRQPSLTSLRTLDDIQNSFDLTIAEAQKVIDREEHERRLSQSESTSSEKGTLVASKQSLVVSQQQILSHIEAAFSAVEEQANEDINSATKEIPNDDDLGWEYTIPEPPPAFRNDDPEPKTRSDPSTPSISPEPSLNLPQSIAPSLDEARSSISSVSSEGATPPLPSLPPPQIRKEEVDGEALTLEESREYASLESHFTAPRYRRPPLLNFTIGSYKKSEEDIFGDSNGVGSLQSVPEASELKSLPEYATPLKDSNHVDVSKKLYVMEGSVRGVRGQVKQICAEMADNGSSPALIGRSASMLSLAPPTRKIVANPVVSKQQPKASVQRANSTAENMRKAQSVQNLNDGEDQSTLDLEQEQARLQEEYAKLHQQFVIWNQQLQDNQHVLENQKIVPNASLPPMNGVSEDNSTKFEVKSYDDDMTMKSQTLPRQRSKFTAQIPVEEKRTSTLERPQRPKSQVLANVTIGSWQQRKPIVENGLSKTPFHSVENINRVAATTDDKQNGYNQSQIKQRPVSVHFGGWSDNKNSSSSTTTSNSNSTAQKDEIHVSAQSKPKIDVQISNFRVQSAPAVSLRSSSTKTNFKPPEVKQTSASRQRLPPEARTEETVNGNVSTENKLSANLQNGRVTRTSSSAFKKFVFGSDDESQQSNSSKTVTYLNGPKELVNGETKTIQVNGGKAPVVSNGFRPSFTIKSAPKVVGFKPVDTSSNKTNGVSVKVAIQPQNNPPPPPPPQPQVPINKSAGKTVVSSATLKSVNANAKKSSRPPPVVQLDPREELMLEIRNFGGRTSLRKVAVSQTNWQLKIHGASSTVTALKKKKKQPNA